MNFEEHRGIGYKYDYREIEKYVEGLRRNGDRNKEVSLTRSLIEDDLFFLMYFVLGVKVVNSSYGVEFCQAVENEDSDRVMWLCAREHLKSITITISDTIRDILKDPESGTLILSYKKPLAVSFVTTIKTIFETNDTLRSCYPEIIWPDCNKAKEWTQERLTVIRKAVKAESSVQAGGLLQGMPTGVHYRKIKYDDIMVHDMAIAMKKNPDIIEELNFKYDMSLNLGTSVPPVKVVVVGTPYFHEDVLNYIDHKGTYTVHRYPATMDGKRDGEPRFLPQEKLDELKKNPYTFNSQQLLDPTPTDQMALNPMFLRYILAEDIPRDLYRFMVIDPAATRKASSDKWAISVWAVKPNLDNIGFSWIYLVDCYIGIIDRSSAYKLAAQMYVRNSRRMMCVAVEEVGLGSDSIHISNAIKALGFPVGEDYGNLQILNPGGKNKEDSILSACQAPLMNMCVHISTALSDDARKEISEQMRSFPWSGKDDWLDTWKYLYKVIKEFNFMNSMVSFDNDFEEGELEDMIYLYQGGTA